MYFFGRTPSTTTTTTITPTRIRTRVLLRDQVQDQEEGTIASPTTTPPCSKTGTKSHPKKIVFPFIDLNTILLFCNRDI
jgi:hypothetical protein